MPTDLEAFIGALPSNPPENKPDGQERSVRRAARVGQVSSEYETTETRSTCLVNGHSLLTLQS